MYIHNYWEKQEHYNIFGDRYIIDTDRWDGGDQPTVWEAGSGKWISGPNRQINKEEIGSEEFNDYLSSLGIAEDRYKYTYIIPTSWATNENSFGRRADNGNPALGEGPDYSSCNIRIHRLNNVINYSGRPNGPRDTFRRYGWEHLQGPNGGNNINTTNNGMATCYIISDRHVLTYRHWYFNVAVGTFSGNSDFHYFMNKEGDVFRKRFKTWQSAGIEDGSGESEEILDERSFGDLFLLELEDEEAGFLSCGLSPITEIARNDQTWGPMNVFAYENQGRSMQFFWDDKIESGTASTKSGDRRWINSYWQVSAEQYHQTPLSPHARIHVGDSGTPTWAYSPTIGYIFLGGINGLNSSELNVPRNEGSAQYPYQIGLTEWESIQAVVRGEPYEAGGDLENSLLPITTPIPGWNHPTLIERPDDLEDICYDQSAGENFTPEHPNSEISCDVSDNFDNTASTNSVNVSAKQISEYFDHSVVGLEFPTPDLEIYGLEIDLNLSDISDDNIIYNAFRYQFDLHGYPNTRDPNDNMEPTPNIKLTLELYYRPPGGEWQLVEEEPETSTSTPPYNPKTLYTAERIDLTLADRDRGIRNRLRAGTSPIKFPVLPNEQLPEFIPESSELKIRTTYSLLNADDVIYEIEIGTKQTFVDPGTISLEVDDPAQVFAGNTDVKVNLIWDNENANPEPLFEDLTDMTPPAPIGLTVTRVYVDINSDAVDSVAAIFFGGTLKSPHQLESFGLFQPVIPPPTISFTEDSTAQDAEVTVGDEIFLEANLTDYIGGTITASINIDGVPVESQTITDATALDADIYSLSYTVTQENVDQNVDWSYSISVSNLAGDSPVQTRSGAIKQLPKINVNPTTTSPGAVVTNGDEIVIDVDLVNMDANGTVTANIVVDGVTVETTTLSSGETSLNLVHTVQNILADTVWSLDVTLTNNFGSVFYSTDGTVDIIETPTITVNEAVSTSGTIVPGDTIVLEATIENYNSVVGSITINGIDTGASGTLTGDVYRIEYTTALDEVDTTSNWVSTITASSATESTSVTKTGSIFVSTEDVPVLEVGTLLPGEWTDTEQPDSYSDGGDHPADQETLPVARWNIIPMQVVPSGGFEVGVVAFHANGIDRVEFEANGGSAAIVNKMTLNTRTGNREYSVNLDMSSGDQLVELRAIVYPKDQGKPFVLQNSEFSYQDTAEEFSRPDYLGNPDHLFTRVNTLTFEIPDDEGGSPEIREAAPTVVSEGQHSMFLWGPNKYSDAPTLYVTPSTGSSTGPGTIDQPYDTLKNAWNENKTSLRNATIILTEPGRYDVRAGGGGSGMNNGNDNDGWVTITASPELNQQVFEDRVILYDSSRDGTNYNFGRINSKAIHFKNLCFETVNMKFIIPNMGDRTYFWFENTYHPDDEGRGTTNPRYSSGLVNSNQKLIAVYVDGALFYDRRKSCGGCTIVRNTEFHKAADTDIYSKSSMVLDCTVHDCKIIDFPSDPHMDIWQWTGGQLHNETYIDVRNKICFGLKAWDQKEMQPLILDQTRSAFYGIAIVDFACDRQQSVGTHKINLESEKDHVLILNCAFDQPLVHDGTYDNSLLQNTIFNGSESESVGGDSLPSGLWAKHCLNKKNTNFEGEGNPPNEGRWENIVTGEYTLEYDGTDLRLEGPGWDLAEALGGFPLPGFNDDPPIGHFQYDEQRTLPVIEVDEISTSDGASILPGDTIILQATIGDFDTVTGSIVVGGSDTGATGVLDGDVYRIEFTTDSTLESTTTWSSNITLTNSEGIVDESRNGLVFVESQDGPRSGPFPSNVGVNGGIVENWEPWSVGRTEMIAAQDAGTDIDFGGRGFYMDVGDTDMITRMDGITLENFHVVGGPKLEWSGPDSNGIYEADIPGDGTQIPRVGSNFQYSSVTCLSVPRLQKNIPFQACWPTNNDYETWPWDIALNFDFFIRTHDNWSSVGETPGTINSSTGEENQPNRIGDILVSDSTSDTGESYNLNWDNLSASRRKIDGLFRGIKIRRDRGGNDTHLELDAILQGVEHISPDDPERTKLHILINADANITQDFIIDSWDPDHIGPKGEEGGLLRITADGTADDLGNRTWKYRGYAHWIITGKKEFIANRPNRYSISWEDGKIYYKPPNNDWIDTEGNPEAFFPVAGRVFNQGMDYTLKRATFSGFANKSAAAAVVDGAAGEGTTTRLENCLFIGNSTNCREGSWDLYECMMWYPDFRGIATFSGPSQIIKTNFYGFPRSSALSPSAPKGDVDSIPSQILPVEVGEILLNGCYFDVTFSNHGQGCSIYTNSWNNVIVTNNIFHNCQRALSFQPGTEPRNPYTAKTIFANNLILYDRYFGPGIGSGQTVFSFNGGPDTHMPRAEGLDDTSPYVAEEPGSNFDNDTVLAQDPQQVRLWNNTILIDESSFTEEELEKSDVGGWGAVQLAKLISSDVVISNNLMIGSGAPEREDNTGSNGHIFRNNVKVDVDKAGSEYTSGKYDYLNTQFEPRVVQTDPIDGFDHENNIIRSTSKLNTSATDGGKVGVRWDSYPTDDVMYNIPVGWYDTYVGSSSNAYEEIGGRTRADFVNDSFVTEDAYAMGAEDRRSYGDPLLVQHIRMERICNEIDQAGSCIDPAGQETNVVTIIDVGEQREEVFQFGDVFDMTSSKPEISISGLTADGGPPWQEGDRLVTKLYFWLGSQVVNEIGGFAGSAGTYDFEQFAQKQRYFDKYEIRFTYRSADGTVIHGTENDPTSALTIRRFPEQPIGSGSFGSAGAYLTLTRSQTQGDGDASNAVGTEEGIFSWKNGDSLEYYIYKINAPAEEDGGVNPREWPEFDETDTTEFPVQGGVVPGDRLYARPVAFFETPAINEYTGSVTARVVVHPYNGVRDDATPNGINRVDFYLNGGEVTSVSTPVTYTTDAGFEEVAYEVTYRGTLSHELNEIRAVVWPNIGRVRILQGTGYFSSDGIDIYGNRVVDDTLEPLTWGPGYNMRERGCLLQVTPATYHISPSGSDVDGNGSPETPYETPQEVYRQHGTSCIIDNSAYNDNSIALNASDFLLVRDVRDFGYAVRSDFDGRIALPIVKGGVMIGVPNTTGGTNPMTLGSPTQDEEIVQGFMFEDGDIRTPAFPADPGESIECHFYNISGGQGSRRANTVHIVLNNCDIGPSDNAIQELMQQRTVGSNTTGIRFDWRGTGGRSPVSLYNCVTRYSHFTNVFEVFHCKSIGIGMLDPYNSEKMFDVHIKSANSWTWPWGPVGEPIICNKGDFDDFVPQTEEGGIATNLQTLNALHAFYELLGAPETAQGSPVPNSTYIDVDGDNWILKSEANVNSADWNTLKSLWDAIPFAENQIFPVAITQLRYEGASPFKARTDIDISAIDPDLFAILGDRKTAKDPHVDIQQSFWDGQYRENPETEELKDKIWLSNTVASSVKIEGNANRYQGIFHADGSAVLESAFWNFEFDKVTLSDSYLLSLGSGHIGQEYGHAGLHVGPNLLMKDPDRAFRVRSGSFYSGLGNATFYDEDSNRFAPGTGSLTDMTGWPEYPQENLVEMIQENGTSHWYYTDVPTPFTLLSSVTFVQEGGENNSTVTEAFNSDRIGTFQPYNQEYTWTVGDVYIANITSGQLRFGPAITWDAGNGADTYGAITSGNSNTAPAEWVNTFLRNEHVLRITITIAGNEKVYIFNQDDEGVFNPQNGYIIIQNNKFDDWDFAGGMTIKMELLST